MESFESLTRPERANLLICFCDIDGFSNVAKARPDPLDLFQVLSGLAVEMAGHLEGSAGRVVKHIGDAALIVFPESEVDAGVRLLRAAKERLERYLADQGIRVTISFQLHFGEVAVGPFGRTGGWDVMGDSVNVAARLERGGHRGRFVISPQVFRKLRPETRKAFHKYPPPIVYLAET